MAENEAERVLGPEDVTDWAALMVGALCEVWTPGCACLIDGIERIGCSCPNLEVSASCAYHGLGR